MDRIQRGGGRGKGVWKWGNPLYASSFRGIWRGALLSGALKVIKGRLWE